MQKNQTPSLQRGIRKWDLVLLIINSIIGAGIFGLPSKIFSQSGVYSLLAFAICAAVVFVFILCFAEVSSRFDKTGGPYVYTLTAFGRFPAFMMGWLLLLSRIFNYATLINLVPQYLSFFSESFNKPVNRFLVILVITSFLTFVNYTGIRNFTRLSNILTVVKLVPLAIFIITGLFFIEPSAFKLNDNISFPSLSNSVLLLVFAFGGFESALVNTGEIREPQRILPFSLFAGTSVVVIFYLLIQVVCIGTLPSLAESKKPLAEAAGQFMGTGGALLITAGAFISILGTLNVLLLSGSRLPYAFSEEKQFPRIFSRLHVKYQTPVLSLLVISIITFIVSVAWSFITALTIAAIIRVLTYALVCVSFIRLRMKDKKDATYYRIPFGYFFAVAGILLSAWLLSASQAKEFRDALICIATGLIFYILYNAWNKSRTGS